MKAVLTFDMEDPEDRAKFTYATKGEEFALVIWDFLNKDLRDWLKYGHEFKNAEDALEGARSTLLERLDEYGLNIDDIT